MKKIVLIFASFSLSGCLSTMLNMDTASTAKYQPNYVAPIDTATTMSSEPDAQVGEEDDAKNQANLIYAPQTHHKLLNHYVEQLALSLSDTLVSSETPTIAVSSFVELNQSLQTTNQLGNQLSEGLMLAMQQFGFMTVDYKVMDNIKIGRRGDYSFSRSVDELNHELTADHVLSGSLIYRPQGVEVQARIVNLRSKALAASARTVVPYYVLQDIQL
ncbi:hypothetical protein PALB_15930 [Pseudoalteromonas luteoviolacea B = ATCC 29581]|nr:hypothetical protein PALB_15930 [Pseudoalteromonas luteoviolacea B = ATCC 29581]